MCACAGVRGSGGCPIVFVWVVLSGGLCGASLWLCPGLWTVPHALCRFERGVTGHL